jgi:hypothetical protein
MKDAPEQHALNTGGHLRAPWNFRPGRFPRELPRIRGGPDPERRRPGAFQGRQEQFPQSSARQIAAASGGRPSHIRGHRNPMGTTRTRCNPVRGWTHGRNAARSHWRVHFGKSESRERQAGPARAGRIARHGLLPGHPVCRHAGPGKPPRAQRRRFSGLASQRGPGGWLRWIWSSRISRASHPSGRKS